jgi:hypothetical protein
MGDGVVAVPILDHLDLALEAVRWRQAQVAGSHHYYGFFGSGNSNANPALLPNPWNANNYGATTFTFDLSNMPGNGMNLLADLQANRFLDVVVADDTSVDYMDLLVEFCQC